MTLDIHKLTQENSTQSETVLSFIIHFCFDKHY